MKESNRLIHIDCMRIIAIFLVIFNHTGQYGFFLFSLVDNPIKQYLYLFLSIFCKVAVPIFFMMSGAVLGGKDESIKEVFRKRVLKYLVILISISMVYWVYKVIFQGTVIGAKEFLKIIYTSYISTPLWFLYSYLAVLLMLPLLRRMAQAMKNVDYIYMAIMSVVFVGIIPIMEYLLFQDAYHINSEVRGVLFLATNNVFFLMGYYFEHVCPKEHMNKKL